MKTNIMNELKQLLKTTLSAYQIARELKEKGIRLSVMGWSEYYVLDGRLVYHHHYGHQEYEEEVQDIADLDFFDKEQVEDFEYPQEITSEIIQALRSL